MLAVLNKAAVPRTISISTLDTALSNCKSFQPLTPADPGNATLVDANLQVLVPADTFVLFTVR